MIRNFRNAYLIALSLIALLTVVSQVFIQLALSNNESDARIVNIAGRQRMLSQRISKTALTMVYLPPDERAGRLQELTTALNEWQVAHDGLQKGSAELGLPGNNSREVRALFAKAAPPFDAIRGAAACLIQLENNTPPDTSCTAAEPQAYIDIILNNEPTFLTLMNQITFQYDAESTARVQQLRNIELTLMGITLTVLILEALLIFRPVVSQLSSTLRELDAMQVTLRHSNEQLEDRIRHRTLELEHANEQLATANREVQDYANAVSHDLRSPIASIRGFLREVRYDMDTLRKHPEIEALPAVQDILNDSLEESVTALEQANDRMDRLTRNILQIARSGERELSSEPVHVEPIIDNLLRSFTPQLQHRQIKATVRPLPVASTDPLAVEQIFSNLISNAIKYTSPERPGVIQFRGWTEGDEVVYVVEDNGRGIAPQDHEKVFQLFRRVGEINVEGEGMGLYYVRHLLTRLNGSISFESKLNQGTTFYVRLPKAIEVEKVLV